MWSSTFDRLGARKLGDCVDSLLTNIITDPWMRWTLLGLLRHRRRQHWVAELVRDRLGVDPGALAKSGASVHPRHIPDAGAVPGVLSWTYYFHGIGCELACESTGERIDVDFYDSIGEYFDPGFYAKYLESLRNPQGPELRVIELHPSFDSVMVTMAALAERGILEPGDARPPALRLGVGILPVEGELTASEVVDDPSSFEARANWLRARVAGDGSGTDVVAYAELELPDLDKLLDEIVDGPPSGRTAGVLEVVAARDVREDVVRVQKIVSSVDPTRGFLEHWLRKRGSEWLRSKSRE